MLLTVQGLGISSGGQWKTSPKKSEPNGMKDLPRLPSKVDFEISSSLTQESPSYDQHQHQTDVTETDRKEDQVDLLLETDAFKAISNETRPFTTDELNSQLEAAALHGQPNEYFQILELAQYRQELADKADSLRQDFHDDILKGSRRISSKVYGWSEPSSILRFNSQQSKSRLANSSAWGALRQSQFDEDDLWTAFKGIQALEYNLEDHGEADRFFNELQEYLTEEHLAGIDPRIIQEHYPWLDTSKKSHEYLFNHEV